MRPQYFATALLVSCVFSVCATAESTQYATVIAEPDVPARVVHYSDLNLQRDQGVMTLYRRIQVAAGQVCAQMNERLPQIKQRSRACALDATSRAVAKVGVPALSTLHASRTQTQSTAEVRVARATR